MSSGGEGETRAGMKLLGVIQDLKVDFRGKVVLDIGSSTGGFTALALAGGASRVIAVEKGTRQMRGDLAHDGRVELHEKTDIFDFVVEGRVDLVLADVSFVSLRKVLGYVRERLVGAGTELLVLLKPQFEVGARDLRRGIVKNSRVRREAVLGFEEWLVRNGFVILGKRDSGVTGRFGNRERFYYLRTK